MITKQKKLLVCVVEYIIGELKMRELTFCFVLAAWAFLIGAMVSYKVEHTKMMERCIEANPTIASGEIKKYCEERLYYKSDE